MGLIFLPICLLVTVRAQQRTQSIWGWGDQCRKLVTLAMENWMPIGHSSAARELTRAGGEERGNCVFLSSEQACLMVAGPAAVSGCGAQERCSHCCGSYRKLNTTLCDAPLFLHLSLPQPSQPLPARHTP